MYLLALTFALAAGAEEVSPYGLRTPAFSLDAPPAIAEVSPYGIIRYNAPAINPPRVTSGLPRMWPAVPVSRPAAKPPPPIVLPDDGLIPPPKPQVPLLNRP